MSSIRSFSVLLFSVAAVTEFAACGSAKPAGTNTVAQKVGTGGGTVKLANNVTLVIPAGALAKETTIGVTSSATAPTGYELDSLRYQFSPEGLTFQQPVTVRLQRLQERAGQGLYWSKANGVSGYDLLPSTVQTADGKTYLEGQTTHFSEAFIGRSSAPTGNSGPTGSSNPSCGTGETSCGGTCVNLADSEAHCGACDNACTGSATCQESICKTAVTIKVAVGPSGAEGRSIAFSALKTGSTWSAMTPSARDGENNITLSFATADSSYEVLIGCTYLLDNEDRPGNAFHLKKSSTASAVALDCTEEEVKPTFDLVSIEATNLPDSEEVVMACGAGGNGTSSASVSKGQADLIRIPVPNSENWAGLVRYNDPTSGAKFGILRNQTTESGSFSASNALDNSATTFSFDFHANDATVDALGFLNVYAYASQGDFTGFAVNLADVYSKDTETNSLSVKSTTLSGLQSSEGHHLVQEFADLENQTWTVDARFVGSPEALNIVMPRGPNADIDSVSEQFEENFYDYARAQQLTAADVNLLETVPAVGAKWHVEFDGAVGPSTNLTLRVPNLLGVPGTNINLFRTPQDTSVTATVRQEHHKGAGEGFSSRTIKTFTSRSLGGK